MLVISGPPGDWLKSLDPSIAGWLCDFMGEEIGPIVFHICNNFLLPCPSFKLDPFLSFVPTTLCCQPVSRSQFNKNVNVIKINSKDNSRDSNIVETAIPKGTYVRTFFLQYYIHFLASSELD